MPFWDFWFALRNYGRIQCRLWKVTVSLMEGYSAAGAYRIHVGKDYGKETRICLLSGKISCETKGNLQSFHYVT